MFWKWLRASCTAPDCFCSQYINTLLIKACLRNTDWTGAWGRLLGGDHCRGWGDTRNISPLLWCQCRIAELLLSYSGHHNDGARQVSADLSSIQTVHALVVPSPVQGRPWRLVQAGQSGGQGTFCRCNDFMLISIIMITATLCWVWRQLCGLCLMMGWLHLLLCCYIQCLHDSISGDDRREPSWGLLLFARYKYKWWQFAWNAANPPIFRRSRLASPGAAPARVTKYPLKVGTSSFISR